MDTDTGTLRRMVWVFPDRESTRAVPKWHETFWDAYEEEAGRLGLTWQRHAPDDIAVDHLHPGDLKVYVAGERVTPADTLFVTSLYSLPYQSQDVFNQYATYAVLEHGGFYLPSPPALSSIVNDKLATILYLKDSPLPTVPTIRIGTGRDLGARLYTPVLADLTFPAIVKPVGWCSGWGICLARDLEDLEGLLSLAQGGETAMAVQPYLGRGTTDLRVFLIDGEPHTVLRRTPADNGYVANVGRGGVMDYLETPPELMETLAYVAKRIPIPFLCVDFLFDGRNHWLSEIEPDGAVGCPDLADETAVARQRAIIRARFEAYRRGHARHLNQQTESSWDGQHV